MSAGCVTCGMSRDDCTGQTYLHGEPGCCENCWHINYCDAKADVTHGPCERSRGHDGWHLDEEGTAWKP